MPYIEGKCPGCEWPTTSREILRVPLTYGGEQQIKICDYCAMIYAERGKPVDYSEGSIYAQPGAVGGRPNTMDIRRFDEIVEVIKGLGVTKTAQILDIGSGQGGLVERFKLHGYTLVTGMDPSAACCHAGRDRGLEMVQGTPGDCVALASAEYDVIILSHVLEHIPYIHGFLHKVDSYLKPLGILYVEVPDADRYVTYDAPFLDFNSEHINHFSEATLGMVLSRHFSTFGPTTRRLVSFSHQGGWGYPAIAMTAGKQGSGGTLQVARYIQKSKDQLGAINTFLARELKSVDEVAIWGVNSFCANITSLDVFNRVKIVQAVDRNQMLHGKVAHCGVAVESPDAIRKDLPIVVTSLMAAESISNEISLRGLRNRIITIAKGVYA